MVTAADTGWSSYNGYEGPRFGGKLGYTLPGSASNSDRYLAVVTATEGGHYDAINMYDRGGVSVGLIQVIEFGQYSVSNMLGVVAESCKALSALDASLSAANAQFKKNASGKWRFSFRDVRGEVNTIAEQAQLFLLNSNGHLGSWDDASRAYAKSWAASFANIWTDPAAREAQNRYIGSTILSYVLPPSKQLLWGKDTPQADDGWVGAARAAFVSFAVNLPVVANAHLLKHVQTSTFAKFSEAWVTDLIQELTYGPQISIYPARYRAIKPVIEHLYGVQLASPTLVPGTQPSVVDVQKELLLEGYDLGPAKADGIFGNKTRDALKQFQQLHGISVTGAINPDTIKALLQEVSKRTGSSLA